MGTVLLSVSDCHRTERRSARNRALVRFHPWLESLTSVSCFPYALSSRLIVTCIVIHRSTWSAGLKFASTFLKSERLMIYIVTDISRYITDIARSNVAKDYVIMRSFQKIRRFLTFPSNVLFVIGAINENIKSWISNNVRWIESPRSLLLSIFTRRSSNVIDRLRWWDSERRHLADRRAINSG